MFYRSISRSACLFFLTVMLIASSPALAIINHASSGEPTDTPNDAVVGRYGTNASLVVISPRYAITTRHQGSGQNVVIGGTTYYTTETNHASADIRILRLYTDSSKSTDAALTSYVGLFNTTDETAAGNNDIVLGGHGRTRGNDLTSGGQVYGYGWATDHNNNTYGMHWATNLLESTGTAGASDIIEGDFDGLGEGGATSYEGILAEYDSGGGMFHEVNGDWYVMALNRGVENHGGQAWFRNSSDPSVLDPDAFDGVRISSYASWIQSNTLDTITTIPEPATMLLLVSGGVAMLIRRRRA